MMNEELQSMHLGTSRSDFSFLAEESLERIFGLKINEKFWKSVNSIFTILADTYPSVVDAAKYPAPASGLNRHIVAVGPSTLFILHTSRAGLW